MKRNVLIHHLNDSGLSLVSDYTTHAVLYDVYGVKYDIDWRAGLIVIGNDTHSPIFWTEVVRKRALENDSKVE